MNKVKSHRNNGGMKGNNLSRSFLNKYAGGGKNNLALTMHKAKKEKQRNLKSAALREYAKLCKKEGIESERVNLNPKDTRRNIEEESTRNGESAPIKKEKRKKNGLTNPFMKEMRQAEKLAADRAEVEKTKISNEEERAQKMRERRRKQKERMRRSSKGQPIMDDTVRRLLSTIQKKEG